MSECGQDVNVQLEDVIANPLPTLPTFPPTTGIGEVIDIDPWPTTGIIGVNPGGQVPTLNTYVPKIGDLAYLIKQGSQWVAIGAMSPRRLQVGGGNGGGFWSWEEFDAGGGSGDGVVGDWTLQTLTGTTIQRLIVNDEVSTIEGAPAVHGDKFVRVRWSGTGPVGAGFAYRAEFTSPPIPASPGQVWRIDGWGRHLATAGSYQAVDRTAITGQIFAPPFTANGEGVLNTGIVGDWQYFKGIRYVVPNGATGTIHAQIVFEVELFDGQAGSGAFFIDYVTLTREA